MRYYFRLKIWFITLVEIVLTNKANVELEIREHTKSKSVPLFKSTKNG